MHLDVAVHLGAYKLCQKKRVDYGKGFCISGNTSRFAKKGVRFVI